MTTLSEPNFTHADGTSINGALPWVDYHVNLDGVTGVALADSFDIISNTAQPVVTDYNYALSKPGNVATPDHYAEVMVKSLGDSSGYLSRVGCGVRVAAGTSGEMYAVLAMNSDGSHTHISLYKMTAIGVLTELATADPAFTANPVNKLLRLTPSGSAPAHLVVSWDGTDVITYDDSSSPITGNTGVAIFGYHNVSSTLVASISAFDAADSGAAVAPNAPTIGTATAGDTTASITFTESTDDGGATITDHTMTSTPGSFTGTGLTSPIIVTGLANGTAYTFKCKSLNSVDYGSESAASNSVTPAEITTPTLGQILDGVATLLAPFLTTAHYDASGFATTAQLNTAVTNIVTSSQLAALFANLATKDEVGVLRGGALTVTDTSHVRIDGATLLADEWAESWLMVKDTAHPRFSGSTIANNTGTGNLDLVLDPPLTYAPGAGAVYKILFVAKAQIATLPAVSPTNILAAFEASTNYKLMVGNIKGQFALTLPGSYPGTGTLVLKDQSGAVTLLTESLTLTSAPGVTARTTA